MKPIIKKKSTAADESRDMARGNNMKKTITIGSDCSGLGADGFAMDLLNLSHRIERKFMSEIEPRTADVHRANHPDCQKTYTSCPLKDRDVNKVPTVDVYTAGPPCQPYGTTGKRQGVKDKGTPENGHRNRGTVLFDVVGYIIARRPKIAIIEEVEGLCKGEMVSILAKVLKLLKALWVGAQAGK